MIAIQIQDLSGTWLTVNTIGTSDPQYVATRLEDARRMSPSGRVRAVDAASGAVIDLR